jgi:hypothetical protein
MKGIYGMNAEQEPWEQLILGQEQEQAQRTKGRSKRKLDLIAASLF